MKNINLQEFECLLSEAYDGLPSELKNKLHNVAIIAENKPTSDQLQTLGRAANEHDLFGLFEGYSQASRLNFGPVLPDRITLFRIPILRHCSDLPEVKEKILSTLKHEIAHHFGSDELGAGKASRKKFKI